MGNTKTSRPPGEQFDELERILNGGSLDEIQVSMVNGKHSQMTREEFDRLYKERVAAFGTSKEEAA